MCGGGGCGVSVWWLWCECGGGGGGVSVWWCECVVVVV